MAVISLDPGLPSPFTAFVAQLISDNARRMTRWIMSAFLTSRLVAANPEPPVTFHRDIAPILFQGCVPCHRPGAAGPFSLLTYDSARKHARELIEVVRNRTMPPWLPAPGPDQFAGTRILAVDEIHRIERWVEAGTKEGDPKDSPPLPRFEGGWQLGPPDLVVQLPQAYALEPQGPDVYRNFVLPIPLTTNRYVRAFEFHPGNPAIHHVRIQLDTSGQCRKADELDSEPGFGGMNPPARYPPGHLLTWAPGRTPEMGTPDMAWLLEARTDVVLQLHLQRTGKRESIQPSLALYFSDQPPTQFPTIVGIAAQVFRIPAGASNHVVRRTLKLPCATSILSLMPHAHYLAKEVALTAHLPDGTERALLSIPRWDFRWQSAYRFQKPVRLPLGTRLEFSITFDNSGTNPHNPNRPPIPVGFGPQSTDEMAEISLQVLPENPRDLPQLQRANHEFFALENIAYFEQALRDNPRDANAHVRIGKQLGGIGRREQAFGHFVKAAEIQPDLAEAHQGVGTLLVEQQQWGPAREALELALRLDPSLDRSRIGLAIAAMAEGRISEAEKHARDVLKHNPSDANAAKILDRIGRPR